MSAGGKAGDRDVSGIDILFPMQATWLLLHFTQEMHLGDSQLHSLWPFGLSMTSLLLSFHK